MEKTYACCKKLLESMVEDVTSLKTQPMRNMDVTCMCPVCNTEWCLRGTYTHTRG